MPRIEIEVQLAPDTVNDNVNVFRSDFVLELSEGGSYYKDDMGDGRDGGICTIEFPQLAAIKKPVKAKLVVEMEREPGYYWVAVGILLPTWEIREYKDGRWWDFHGQSYAANTYNDVDEDRIARRAK